jgi:phosphoserine phosphatase RsbU/P
LQCVPLGIISDFVSAPFTKVRLQKGDIFVLITDGFVEFENAMQEQFGKERLEQSVRNSRCLLPDQIIENVHNAVLRFSNGTNQQDDLTAVLSSTPRVFT